MEKRGVGFSRRSEKLGETKFAPWRGGRNEGATIGILGFVSTGGASVRPRREIFDIPLGRVTANSKVSRGRKL